MGFEITSALLFQAAMAVCAGGLVGFILGLLGGGGSVLATPLLIYGVGVSPHVAIGTGALAVSANAFVNFCGHARHGHVWWRSAILFAVIGSLGALLGSTIGKAFDSEKLVFLFGVLMLAIGMIMMRPSRGPTNHQNENTPGTQVKTAAIALVAGLASGFFGIGGGFLIVPGLILATGMPTASAVGSSLLAVAAFGLATAVNYGYSGLVDWAVGSQFILGGILGGVGGMATGRLMSMRKDLLRKCFAGLVLIVAVYVISKSLPVWL